MGLQIRVVNANTSAEIDAAFATFANERPDALFISSGPFFLTRRVQLAHLATRYANGRDRRSENPILGHAQKERVSLFGTDQRITSGPAVKTAAYKGRIHDCTRTLR